MSFINHVKIVKMNVFEFCMKTQKTSPPLGRFPAIAWIHNQSDSVASFDFVG